MSELFSTYKHSGRHALLRRVTSLSISCLQKVDEETDDIYIRTHPMYEVASIVKATAKMYFIHILMRLPPTKDRF